DGSTNHGRDHRDGGHTHRLVYAHALSCSVPNSAESSEIRHNPGLRVTWLTHTTLFILLLGFGHSVLAMSGEETLAQVNREIAHPKLLNLKKAAVVIGVYALLFTALTSFFAVMIIPDTVRPEFFGNLIGGIAMHLWGPLWARLIFHGFVVLVGVLILSGAHNTSI